MRTLFMAVKLFAALSVLTGIIYPLGVWAYAQAFFSDKANGGIVSRGGQTVGAELIAQKFTRPEYFWPRHSAVDYNPMPSGGSNMSLTSKQLRESVAERKGKLGVNAPADLLFASGSGLDPHITPEAARFQCARVAAARGVPEVDIMSLVADMTEPRQFGFLGEPRVNVLRLNLALDEKYRK